MKSLKSEDRLRLMRFVCSFAWADLEVKKEERAFIGELIKQLQLDPSEIQQVDGWLAVPPLPEEVDPAEVPIVHRELFLDAVRAVIAADGAIGPEEHENYRLLKALLR
ncbi:MAG: TerB family tellurite resistance protein [Polyangiaceae bacterium]|jgi:hypothetical protein|nr:TerB family tellurite resistance protein [Polyangiaceae bacterium]